MKILGKTLDIERISHEIDRLKKLSEAAEIFFHEGAKGIPEKLKTEKLSSFKGELLGRALAEQREFSDNPNLAMNQGSNWSPFTPSIAGRRLYRRALQVGDSGAAVKWLMNVLQTKSTFIRRISLLWNIEVDRVLHISEKVSVVPVSELSTKSQEEVFAKANPLVQNLLMGGSPRHPGSRPSSAIVARIAVDPLFTDDPENFEIIWTDSEDEIVRMCLAILVESAIPVGSVLYEFENEEIEAASGGRMIPVPTGEIQPHEYEAIKFDQPDRLRELFNNYLRCGKIFRDKAEVAIGSFERAFLRTDPGDKAADASTSLESLLLHSERGDNRYKVSLRTALIAAENLDDRKRIRNLISILYDLRSAKIHDGVTPEERKILGEKVKSSVIADEAIGIVAATILRLLELTDFPDWVALELGGQLRPLAQN